jgi:hypothetical protein
MRMGEIIQKKCWEEILEISNLISIKRIKLECPI